MNLGEYLARLETEGIRVWSERGELCTSCAGGALPASVSEMLSDFKDEIISWLQERDADAGWPAIAPAPSDRHEPFPLTDTQYAYWVGRSGAFELGSVSTHVYVELDCVDLDVERASRAWQAVVDRHEMLRAIVRPDGRQQILPGPLAYTIPIADLGGEPAEVVAAHLDAVRGELSHQVLPADRWPLFDIRATRIDAARVRLHVSLDVLFCDFGSLLKVLNEWRARYEGAVDVGGAIELSFRDYVLAAGRLQSSPPFEQARDYWLARVPDLPLPPELPLAKAPGQLASVRFAQRAARLEAARWSTLKERAGRHGLTANGVLVAAFAEVLRTWSKTPRFTLNLTLFNRLPLHPDAHALVGDFTTLTLLAVESAAGEPFARRAARLQQRLWEDLDRREFTGVQVLRELARHHRTTGALLMPVVFTSGVGLEAGTGFEPFGTAVYAVNQTPQVWLDHVVTEVGGALAFSWNTVDELFPPGMIDDMFAAYRALLDRLASADDGWSGPVPSLVPPAHAAAVERLNRTTADVPPGLLHAGAFARAASAPEAIAVVSPGRTLSYGQLGRLARQVARWLQDRGARPDTLVAVAMEKGWEQVVAVLGTLAAGAAYLPIDPELPVARQAHLFAEGRVALGLTTSGTAGAVAWPAACETLSIDRLDDEADRAIATVDTTPGALAYVIYTSGSTGLPKGVAIDHRGAVNTIRDVNARYGVNARDRVLAVSALNFDLSVYDVFGLLAAGGVIVMPHPARRLDPAHWAELVAAHGVTVWNSVPALLQMLVEDVESGRADRSALATLRVAMLSGDWIPLSLPDRARALVPGLRVHSLGGATEASIWSIQFPIGAVDPAWASVPYGTPLANQTVRVLDEALEVRPAWVPGQLYIGGLGVAVGYWNDPPRTEASFVRHPRTGERLYKTGDLGRYLADGTIEFLGREDAQVKIRGHRIELGEIEAALLQHGEVSEAAVAAVGSTTAGRELVAYVVRARAASSGSAMSPEDLARYRIPLVAREDRIEFKLRRLDAPEPTGDAVALPQPASGRPLDAAWLARQSYRRFVRAPIPIDDLAALLASLSPIAIDGAPFPKYRYPSADSLYPVQTYLFVKADRVESLAAGFYWHDAGRRRLVRVSGDEDEARRLYAGEYIVPVFEQAGFAIFFVADMSRIVPLCGDLSPGFCMLEAGCMLQLLMTEAPARLLGLCPISVVDDRRLREVLGLGADHQVLHSAAGGRIAPPQMAEWRCEGVPAPSAADRSLPDRLRGHLAARLPHYMVPAQFVVLDALPLTPNGKVDRSALPPPGAAARAYDVAPATRWEEKLSAILRGVLGGEPVSVTASFFELGANSLQLVRVAGELTRQVGRHVSVVDVFRNPTIRALAAACGDAGAVPFDESTRDGQRRGAARRAARELSAPRR